MATLLQTAIILATALVSAQAAVQPPKWVTGEAGKNCEEVCQAEDLHCIGGYWPANARTLLSITALASKEGASECVAVTKAKQSKFPESPFIQDATKTCYYQSEINIIGCQSQPPNDPSAPVRRFCPCSQQAPQFILADIGKSCTDFCRSRGGACGSDPGLWPTDEAAVKAKLQPLGMTCSGGTPISTVPFHAPSISGDNCYWPANTADTSCDASQSDYRRLCPCLGASLYATSGSSGSQSSSGSQGSSQGSQRSDGNCRGGTFKIGKGTGGTRKLVPGGTRAHNSGECKQRVLQYCPGATGATYNHQNSECWCENGMTGYSYTQGYSVCWFSDGTQTSGNGDLISTYGQFDGNNLATGMTTSIGAACAFVAIGIALSLRLVQWGSARPHDQVASGEAVLVRDHQDSE